MPDLYLLRASLKDLLLPKKLLVALALAALPAIIAAIWRGTASQSFKPETAYNLLAGDLIFGFVLVILAVTFGTGAVAQEMERKTIVYLLTRPLPRWRILLVKFVAAALGIIVTAWVASLLLALVSFGFSGFGKSPLGKDFLILPVGALAYGAVFLLIAVLVKRPLLIGLLFAFGWESWVPNLPGNFQKVSLIAYLRALSPHPKPQSEVKDFSQLFLSAAPQEIQTKLAWEVLIGTILVGLLLALWLFSVREYSPRDDAE